MPSDASHEREAPPIASGWEWVFAALSGLLVLGVVAYLLFEALSRRDSPPLLRVEVGATTAAAGRHVVEFWVHNDGGTTAAALQVEGVLTQDTATVETSAATLDFVPAESRRQAGLIFSRDPRRYRLEIRPLGYELP